MIKVILIFRKGQASVVEVNEGISVKRFIVPSSSLIETTDNEFEVSDDDLSLAVEYGVPFVDLLSGFCVTSGDISDQFHSAGIWTVEDMNNPQKMHSALMNLVRPILSETKSLFKKMSRKE